MELSSRVIDNIAILTLNGRFDAHERPKISAWLDKNVSATTAQVLVNMSGVHFIDSTGLSSLVQGMKHCRQEDGDLSLCELQQPVRIIFELTRLDKAFDLYTSEAEGLKGMAAKQE
jgi:anti-sigma B factor antagonist